MRSTVVIGVGLTVAMVNEHASVCFMMALGNTPKRISCLSLLTEVYAQCATVAHLETDFKLSIGPLAASLTCRVQRNGCSLEQCRDDVQAGVLCSQCDVSYVNKAARKACTGFIVYMQTHI